MCNDNIRWKSVHAFMSETPPARALFRYRSRSQAGPAHERPPMMVRRARRVLSLPVALGTLMAVAGMVVVASGSLPRIASAQAETIVRLVTEASVVEVGDDFGVIAEVADVADLGGFQLTLAWDERLLEERGVEIDESFLGGTGRLVETLPPVREPGQVTLIAYSISPSGPTPGVGGSGALARITFRARQGGTTRIELIEALLTDTASEPIPNEALSVDLLVEGLTSLFLPYGNAGD